MASKTTKFLLKGSHDHEWPRVRGHRRKIQHSAIQRRVLDKGGGGWRATSAHSSGRSLNKDGWGVWGGRRSRACKYKGRHSARQSMLQPTARAAIRAAERIGPIPPNGAGGQPCLPDGPRDSFPFQTNDNPSAVHTENVATARSLNALLLGPSLPAHIALPSTRALIRLLNRRQSRRMRLTPSSSSSKATRTIVPGVNRARVGKRKHKGNTTLKA